jgi:hypothetical protein
MALWGNNDAKGSGGTVSLDYDNLLVTGSGTTFGQVGAAATGDVIRFGTAFGVHYGDAVIVGIASTTQLSIASTAGLSGDAISGVAFEISESPKFAVLDSHWNQSTGNVTETYNFLQTSATYTAGVGTDKVLVGSVAGVTTGDKLNSGAVSIAVASIGSTSVSLASTIGSAITAGSLVTFSRVTGGHESSVIGINTAGVGAATSTRFELTHSGWVGIMTYMDSEGNLRVKSEVLVAMSGITTGNTATYPPF